MAQSKQPKTEREIIADLQHALETGLTGGNHIATNLIGSSGPNFPEMGTPHEDVQKYFYRHFQDAWLPLYEQWCCWNALMKARDIAREALQDYDGEVKGCFQP